MLTMPKTKTLAALLVKMLYRPFMLFQDIRCSSAKHSWALAGSCNYSSFYLASVLYKLSAGMSEEKLGKWVTREKAKVDRIACPWLITHFVDKEAEFLFVPKDKVKEVASKENAIPFDAPNVELTHYEESGREHVSFDAIIRKYNLKDPTLLELAKIVRGADAKIEDTPPESAGLEAAATGFRNIAKDDYDNMRLQFPMYDALYNYCQLKVERMNGKQLK